MAEYIRFVDAVNGEPCYDSAVYAQAEEVKAEGVAYGYLNQLEVIEDTALQVIVKDGGMVSRGRIYIQDEPYDGTEPKTIAVEATASGYLRKDRVVIEFDIDNKAAAAKIVKGTEVTADPAVPELTDDSDNWQVSLATINVSGSEITSIEDERIIGNGRTNPVFSEDVSAPNIKINDGGKIYLNDAETAYLQYSSDELNLKLSDSSETEGLRGNPAAKVLFSAYMSTDTEAASGDVLNFDSVEWDISDNYNEDTKTFTAPMTGIYEFKGQITITSPDDGKGYGFGLYKDGGTTQVFRTAPRAAGTLINVFYGEKEIYLEQGDNIIAKAVFSNSKTIQGILERTFLQGKLVYEITLD